MCVSGERFGSLCVDAWVLQWVCACVAQEYFKSVSMHLAGVWVYLF